MTPTKKGKKKGKRFLPEFRPMYVEVLAEDSEGHFFRLQITRPIQYDAGMIRVFVRKSL